MPARNLTGMLPNTIAEVHQFSEPGDPGNGASRFAIGRLPIGWKGCVFPDRRPRHPNSHASQGGIRQHEVSGGRIWRRLHLRANCGQEHRARIAENCRQRLLAPEPANGQTMSPWLRRCWSNSRRAVLKIVLAFSRVAFSRAYSEAGNDPIRI